MLQGKMQGPVGVPRARSASEPSRPINCSLLQSRFRIRHSELSYEQGKDIAAHSLGKWTSAEVCSVLNSLVSRCSLNQLQFLWTALESVPHKDFMYQATKEFPDFKFRPLSTPSSRAIKSKFLRSRRPENKSLHRAPSATIVRSVVTACKDMQFIHTALVTGSESGTPQTSIPQAAPLLKLPGLRPSTAPEQSRSCIVDGERRNMQTTHWQDPVVTLRLTAPARRHMEEFPLHHQDSTDYQKPSDSVWHERIENCTERSAVAHVMLQPRQCFWSKCVSISNHQSTLPDGALEMLKWFANLEKHWQQQDLLQLIVWNLDQRELYYLVTLIMSRQYCDFITVLPSTLARKVLAHVSGKDLLRACQVSSSWNDRCSCEELWKTKCSQTKLGMPQVGALSFKTLFIDNIKLKRNWRLGRYAVTTLTSHTHRVLCVAIKQDENILTSGGADGTVRVWRLGTGEMITTLRGHTRGVWCVAFFGRNMLLSGSSDCTVRVWNFRTGTCERSLEGHAGTVWSLKQKRDILITGSHDTIAILWNIRHCSYLKKLKGHKGVIFAVDLSEDARVAFTASGDKTIRVWEVSKGRCVQELQACPSLPVIALHYTKGILATSSGSTISLWSTVKGERVVELHGHKDRVEKVHVDAYGSNAGTLLSCSRDGTIKYWNICSGRCIRTITGHEGTINCVDRNGANIVSAADDHTIKIWDFRPSVAKQSSSLL